jgi:glycosyltransferase involved in cell wall biosynthesis
MRIAFVNQPWDYMLPSMGGSTSSIAIITYEFAKSLSSRHEVIVYGPGRNKALRKVMETDRYGICYRAIPGAWPYRAMLEAEKRVRQAVGQPTDAHNPPYGRRSYQYPFAWQIARDLRTLKPDLIVVHNMFVFAPIIRALNPDSTLALMMLCDWLAQLDRDRVRKAIQGVDLLIGISEHVTQGIANRFPDLAERCHTVHMGIDPNDFKVNERRADDQSDGRSLLYVGRLSPEKGIHVMLDAFPDIHRSASDARLDLVGPTKSAPVEYMVLVSDDPRVRALEEFYDVRTGRDIYGDKLRERIPPSLADHVHFHGGVPHANVSEHMQTAYLLINASLTEAYGLPVMEAMASGLPVIGARVGGVPDLIVDGETGLLFEPGDARGLAQAATTLLQDPARRDAMGQAARHRAVERFTWAKSADTLLSLYAPRKVI